LEDPVRVPVLIVTLLFIAGLGVLTALEIAKYGVTVLSVLAVLVLALFAIGIVGALRNPPRQ
jgi:NADH:ubiquinone oxidoreductase subunit 6 (subunit J)